MVESAKNAAGSNKDLSSNLSKVLRNHISLKDYSSEIIHKSSAKYKEYSRQELYLQNMTIQLVRGFWGKSAQSAKYLQKRKRKRNEFMQRLNAYDYSTSFNEQLEVSQFEKQYQVAGDQ